MPSDNTNPPTSPASPDVLDAARAWGARAQKSYDGDRMLRDAFEVIPSLVAEVVSLRAELTRRCGVTWPKPPGELGPPF